MYLPVFHVDAFTAKPFGGNPAAVCPLPDWLDDDLLRSVAAESNLSETAYLVPRGDQYDLRWFTPRCEANLCGHATLASGLVLLQILAPGSNSGGFQTRVSGSVTVSRDGDLMAMHLPAKVPWACAHPPAELLDGLGIAPSSVMQIEDDYFAVSEDAKTTSWIGP